MGELARARGYAKLNLALAVTGRRPDGYHTLDTIMQTLELWDEVTVSHTQEPGITVTCDASRIPLDGGNTAAKAASRYMELTAMPGGARIHIRKRIPVEAGMGGSSADAAAVLLAMQKLHQPLSEDILIPLAASLGADVPFQLKPQTARCRGIGEQLTPLPGLEVWYVICKPPFGISTPACFAAYDRLVFGGAGVSSSAADVDGGLSSPVADVDGMERAIRTGDVSGAGRCAVNVLEAAAGRSELTVLRQKLLAAGALGAAMTGSGSAVFGMFPDAGSAEKAAAQLRPHLTDTLILIQKGYVSR